MRIYIFFLSLLWVHMASGQGLDEFIHGRFEDAADSFLKNPNQSRLRVLSLVSAGRLEQALSEIEQESKGEEFSNRGPWVEGHFLKSWILQDQLPPTPARLEELRLLINSSPDPIHARFLLAKAYLSLGKQDEAREILRPVLGSNHPLAGVAEIFMPEATLTHEQRMNADLRLSTSLGAKVQVTDPILGIDPLAVRETLTPHADVMGSFKYAVFKSSSHTIKVGYGLNSVFMFSNNLRSYDRLVHGPLLEYGTHFLINRIPCSVDVSNMFLDGETELSRPTNFLMADVVKLRFGIQVTNDYSISIENDFAYARYRTFVATNSSIPGFTPQELYSSGMSGIKLAGVLSQRIHFDHSFFFSFPLNLTWELGGQRQMADGADFDRTAFLTALGVDTPLRWGIDMSLKAQGSLNRYAVSNRGSEYFLEGHFTLQKNVTRRTFLDFDSGIYWRKASLAQNTLYDFSLLLQARYQL